MKEVAAYLLCVMGGNASPSAADVKKVLEAGGAKVDDSALDTVIAQLGGKDLDALVKEGTTKLSSITVSGGGGGGGGAAPAGGKGAAPAGGGKPAAAAKAPEPEPEPEEDMGFSLFD